MDEEADFDQTIDEWLTHVKRRAEKGKDEKTESERANPYRLEKFYKHLCTLATQFPLSTAVMRKYYNSSHVRPTSCYVEGKIF